MFCAGAARSALEALEQPELAGTRAHALGPAKFSAKSKLQDFRIAMNLFEKQLASAQPNSSKEFGEETLLATRMAIHNQVTGLRLWLQKSNLYRYELVRQACNEIKALQYVDDPEDEDNFYVSNEFLLVSITRPKETHDKALEVEICVNNAQQELISRMSAECNELRRAIDGQDLPLVVNILKHIVFRARTLLSLHASETSKLEAMSEYGYHGRVVLELDKRRGELNYEVDVATGLLVYVLQITPPLPAVGRILLQYANHAELPSHQPGDLLALLQSMQVDTSTRVITQTSAKFGKSIGLYSLEGDGEGGRELFRPAPQFGRLEHADRQVLETLGVGFVQRQHATNHLLASCFEPPPKPKEGEEDESKVKHLYAVKVGCYPGGLLLSVEVSGAECSSTFDLYVDVDTLSVNIEMEEDGMAKMDLLMQTMSARLKETMRLPEICHLCVAVFSASALPRDAKQPRLG
ncbi:hypothetical protein BASA81_003825 [Batrachochytrium salamandrivorans]|nr:hypothetical protein BASA81_003825 [Batrachochytrium salamandrivorans]